MQPVCCLPTGYRLISTVCRSLGDRRIAAVARARAAAGVIALIRGGSTQTRIVLDGCGAVQVHQGGGVPQRRGHPAGRERQHEGTEDRDRQGDRREDSRHADRRRLLQRHHGQPQTITTHTQVVALSISNHTPVVVDLSAYRADRKLHTKLMAISVKS